MEDSEVEDFLFKMPKIELHAHLNGSLNINSIRELGVALYGENSKEFLALSQKFIEFNGLKLNDCFEKFKFMHELTSTKRGLELATLMVIRNFAEENVIHLELRTTPKSSEQRSKLDYLECVLKAIHKAKEIYSNIQVKLIPSIDRSQSVETAEETLQIVLKLYEKYPETITGLDFSGNPHCGKFEDFKPLLEKARKSGLSLTLHCAEIDNPEETAAMVKFGMERCGHGTFLTKDQLKELKERNTVIECCLTSNVKCQTVSSYDDHHFYRIFQFGSAPTVLCTDDSGVFDTTLTREFLLAGKTFKLQKQDFMRLTLNSIEHAFANVLEKIELHDKVMKYFDQK